MSANRLTPLHPAWLLAPLGLVYAGVLLQLVLMSAFPDARRVGVAAGLTRAESSVEVPRASILDRHGVPLAVSVPEWRLVVDDLPRWRRYTRPEYSFTDQEVAAEMAPVAATVGLPLTDLVAALRGAQQRSVLAERLSPETVSRLRPLLRATPGTGLKLENFWRRDYPQAENLSHLVGFAIHEGAKGPTPEIKGKSGLEYKYDLALRGQPGTKKALRVTAAFGINPAMGYSEPVPAVDQRTTLDAALSARLRQELVELMAEHRTDWAGGLVLDPRSGEILALAGLPDYDPNDPGAKLDEKGEPVGTSSPMGWGLSPGSTMKPLVVARALATGAIGPRQSFSQDGGRWYARGAKQPPIRNARGVPNRPLDWRETVIHSSNIAAGKIGMELGRERLRELLLDLRFDQKIDQLPMRHDIGLLGSDYLWSERQTRWTVPSVSIGHQFLVTPLRLAAAHASLINGGLLFDPHLEVGDAAAPTRVFPEHVARQMQDAMVGMVQLEKRDWLNDVPFAWGGKSGTVQHEVKKDQYTSLFVGFAPAEDPRYLALVVAKAPKGKEYYGSRVAGPAVRDLLHWALSRDGDVAPLAALDPATIPAIVPTQER